MTRKKSAKALLGEVQEVLRDCRKRDELWVEDSGSETGYKEFRMTLDRAAIIIGDIVGVSPVGPADDPDFQPRRESRYTRSYREIKAAKAANPAP